MSAEHLNQYSSTERVHLDRIRACIRERGYRTAVELGVHTGGSFLHIVDALQANGGGTAIGIDVSRDLLDRAQAAVTRWAAAYPDVQVHLIQGTLPDAITDHVPQHVEFVFIDDFHDPLHVELEIALLLPRMVRPSTIMGHDVNSPPGIGDVFVAHGGVLHREGCGLGEITLL